MSLSVIEPELELGTFADSQSMALPTVPFLWGIPPFSTWMWLSLPVRTAHLSDAES